MAHFEVGLMIIFFEYGGLGNQLFQYLGIKKYFPNQRVILLGCDELLKNIINIDAVFIKKDSLSKVGFHLLCRLFLLLASLRIIGAVSESNTDSDYAIHFKRGVLPGLSLLMPSFFQHCQAIERATVEFKLRPEILEKAKNWLKDKRLICRNVELVFMHVRRGDYIHWPSRENPAVLSADWYRRAMQRIKKEVENPMFVILSNDPWYVYDVFGESDDQIISDNDMDVDFALMSLCNHGILSASSFSWWGAYFSRENKNETSCFLLAPKYWAGHRKREWYPPYFKVDWITYID